MELLTAARPYARAAFACARQEAREDWAMQLAQLGAERILSGEVDAEAHRAALKEPEKQI